MYELVDRHSVNFAKEQSINTLWLTHTPYNLCNYDASDVYMLTF